MILLEMFQVTSMIKIPILNTCASRNAQQVRSSERPPLLMELQPMETILSTCATNLAHLQHLTKLTQTSVLQAVQMDIKSQEQIVCQPVLQEVYHTMTLITQPLSNASQIVLPNL
jgi:hypothetical protein